MKLAPCTPGDAVITPGFALRASYVIHAVGPIWEGGHKGEVDEENFALYSNELTRLAAAS